MKHCIYKLYMGFCCLLQDCKCINNEREKTIDHINAFKYIGL